MASDHATPVPPRALFVLRDGDGTGTGGTVPEASTASAVPVSVEASTGDGTEVQPVPASVPMTVPERTRLAVTHWAGTAANGAGQMWLHPGRVGYALYHGRPESLAERRAYVKSRAWLPKEIDADSKTAKVIVGEVVVFHWIAGLIQIPLLILYAALDRQIRLIGLIAAVLVFVLVILPHIHIPLV